MSRAFATFFGIGLLPNDPVASFQVERTVTHPQVDAALLILAEDAVAALDLAWQQHGFPSRVEFIRHALGLALTDLGETDAAALIRNA